MRSIEYHTKVKRETCIEHGICGGTGHSVAVCSDRT